MVGVHIYDILLVIGDFNAKVAPARKNRECIVGPLASSRVANKNGENFCNFCNATNGFCIGNTFSSTNAYSSGHGVHLMEKRAMKLTTFALVKAGEDLCLMEDRSEEQT